MELIRLPPGTTPWGDIADAANILWRAPLQPDIGAVTTALRNHYSNEGLNVVELTTALSKSRRGMVITNGEKITIAFFGSDPDEIIKNTWIDAKKPGWWKFPYPRYDNNGNRVHSFYLDMWHDMRGRTYDALSNAVGNIVARGATPKQIIITGFSMGGGISILAFTDILENIRQTWGSVSPSPCAWALDDNDNLGSLIQHLTFAAVSAGNLGYNWVLNDLYIKYRIRAWDFFNIRDWTIHSHHPYFRSYRGHRYNLPEAVVGQFFHDFGNQGHNILGYLKSAEWIYRNGTDQLESCYNYV